MSETAERSRIQRFLDAIPQSRIGRIAFWLTAGSLICLAGHLLADHNGFSDSLRNWAITLLVLASPFLLISGFRYSRRKLLWKVRNRLILTYLLMGLAPVILFGTLAATTDYVLAGQYSINSALDAMYGAQQQLQVESSNVAGLLLAPQANAGKGPLNFEQIGNSREGEISVAVLKNGLWQTVPLISRQGPSPASPFAGQPKPAWLQPSFHDAVAFGGRLYFCRYTHVVQGKQSAEVLSALEMDHGALNTLASSLGRILLYSGTGFGSRDIDNAEDEANSAEQAANQARESRNAQREAQRDAQQAARDAQQESREEVRDARQQVAEAERDLSRSLRENDARDSPEDQAEVKEALSKAQMNLQARQSAMDAELAKMQQGLPSVPSADRAPPVPEVGKQVVPVPETAKMSATRKMGSGIAANAKPPAAVSKQSDRAAPAKATPNPKAAGFAAISGGTLPAPASSFDPRVYFTAPFRVISWQDGANNSALLVVISRSSSLYTRLFSTSVEIGSFWRNALVVTAVVFGLLELLALWMATRLSRTITRSVAGLTRGTTEIDNGNLQYRIKPDREDQLGALAHSFNSMAGSIEHLLVQQREKERLLSELAIAQEVQSNLFPSSPATAPGLQLHAVCLPARTVSGDYFDFIFQHRYGTCIALGDISGKGISAALLMASLHSAVRAFSLGDDALVPSPARLLELLNRHLYSSTQANKYATLFLAFYNQQERRLIYSNGGHLPPFVLSPDGTVQRLEVGGPVVGLLDGLQYEEATVHLQPGDLLVAYTDGLTEPENDSREFGEERLLQQLLRSRNDTLPMVMTDTFEALKLWIGEQEQPDDMTLLLARQL